MSQVGDEERIIRDVMNVLTSSAKYMVNEVKNAFSRYIDIYRGISGFESEQVSFGSKGNARSFVIQSSITEPNYDINNYLVNAFKGFVNIDENFYPTYLMNGIECFIESEAPRPNTLETSERMVTVYGEGSSLDDESMGHINCVRRASVRFSQEIPGDLHIDPVELLNVSSNTMNTVRGKYSGMRNDFLETYGFEPGDITLTGNEVMLSTVFDLNISSAMREYIQKIFENVIPNQVPELMGIGLLCGTVPDLVFSYDDTERILVIGHPHKVSSGDCLKYSIIKYV